MMKLFMLCMLHGDLIGVASGLIAHFSCIDLELRDVVRFSEAQS